MACLWGVASKIKLGFAMMGFQTRGWILLYLNILSPMGIGKTV